MAKYTSFYLNIDEIFADSKVSELELYVILVQGGIFTVFFQGLLTEDLVIDFGAFFLIAFFLVLRRSTTKHVTLYYNCLILLVIVSLKNPLLTKNLCCQNITPLLDILRVCK